MDIFSLDQVHLAELQSPLVNLSPESHSCMSFVYLQEWWLHPFPGQPVPLLDSFRKAFFPVSNPKEAAVPPLSSTVGIAISTEQHCSQCIFCYPAAVRRFLTHRVFCARVSGSLGWGPAPVLDSGVWERLSSIICLVYAAAERVIRSGQSKRAPATQPPVSIWGTERAAGS